MLERGRRDAGGKFTGNGHWATARKRNRVRNGEVDDGIDWIPVLNKESALERCAGRLDGGTGLADRETGRDKNAIRPRAAPVAQSDGRPRVGPGLSGGARRAGRHLTHRPERPREIRASVAARAAGHEGFQTRRLADGVNLAGPGIRLAVPVPVVLRPGEERGALARLALVHRVDRKGVVVGADRGVNRGA